MNIVLNGVFFLTAAAITLRRGAGIALVFAYLPALLLFSKAVKLVLPGLPDINPAGAAIYGILAGGLASGRRPRLRMNAVDAIIALMLCVYAISGAANAGLYNGISVLGGMGVHFGFIPYFIVRCALRKQPFRRRALLLLVILVSGICAIAVIEARLWPETYLNLLRALGLRDPDEWSMVLRRFGFFRAASSFVHPIDLGISGALLFTMVAMAAWRLRIPLRTPWIAGGMALALIASFCGISFGAFFGLGVGSLLYLLLMKFPRHRRWLPAAVVLMIVLGFITAAHWATGPTSERSLGEIEVLGSLRNRQELAQLSWDFAKTAGFFGWGSYLPEEIDRSVDSAYLLIAMKRGWAGLALWLALPFCLTSLALRGVRSASSRSQVKIILAGTSAILGTMVTMFTVWFGFVYAHLFMVILALTVNESQSAIHAKEAPRRSAVTNELARAANQGSGSTMRHASIRGSRPV